MGFSCVVFPPDVLIMYVRQRNCGRSKREAWVAARGGERWRDEELKDHHHSLSPYVMIDVDEES
jgi:hypothetical protein